MSHTPEQEALIFCMEQIRLLRGRVTQLENECITGSGRTIGEKNDMRERAKQYQAQGLTKRQAKSKAWKEG